MLHPRQGDPINYIMLSKGYARLRKNLNTKKYCFLDEWIKIEMKLKI